VKLSIPFIRNLCSPASSWTGCWPNYFSPNSWNHGLAWVSGIANCPPEAGGQPGRDSSRDRAGGWFQNRSL